MNQDLEAFSYSVSHDLRAPLRGIDGFSQAILEDYNDVLDETGKDYLRRVRTGAQRMAAIIDDLLNLSRVSRTEMKIESVDLSAMAREILSHYQEEKPERHVDIVIAAEVKALGDRGLLRIVLENLLNNAWKYTSKKPQGHIEFGQSIENGQTVYYVSDNGVGFDIRYSDKLFGAFQRLHHASEFPGTGIGLATVQRIIFRHGGKIWAESELNNGAKFCFVLAPPSE